VPLWFSLIWAVAMMSQFQTYLRTHHHVPGQAATAFSMLLSVYAVPVLVFIGVKLRRHLTRQSVFRRARAVDPKPLAISGYAVFAVCHLIRKRIRKQQSLSVSVSPREAMR
jgi:hypothetical protein